MKSKPKISCRYGRAPSASHVDVDPKSLDSVLPANEFAVMEADSSQQCAISGIVAGQSAVVHGTPGTGKSQTTTNLIATLAATGKKVLFVVEKRAALEVVMNRLRSVGLDHLAIDLHGAEQTPKKVMEHVAKTLNMVGEASLPAADEIHSAFVDRRNVAFSFGNRCHWPYIWRRDGCWRVTNINRSRGCQGHGARSCIRYRCWFPPEPEMLPRTRCPSTGYLLPAVAQGLTG